MRISATGLVLLSLALLSSATYGATVTGEVKAPDGAPFRGAFVQAQNTGTKMTVSVLSNAEGRYAIEICPAGQYQLQIRAPGYRADPRANVALAAEQKTSFDFPLKKDAVHWNELSQYQGTVLFPSALGNNVLRGKDTWSDGVLPTWIPDPHGVGQARREWLARPRQLHARRDAFFPRQCSAIHRPRCR